MRKPDKVIEVFQFLRRKFGGKFAAGDLLAFAQELTRQKAKIEREDRASERGKKRRIFPFIATDEALKDGGWQLMEFERTRHNGLVDECDEDAHLGSPSMRDWDDI